MATAGAVVAVLAYLWGEHVGEDRGVERGRTIGRREAGTASPKFAEWIREHRVEGDQ